MKKLYAVSTLLLTIFGFLNSGFAQYTATHTGSWNSALTWAPGAIPSATCNNCTITINANVTVTLNADILLKGNTTLTVGTDASSAAGIVIPFSTNIAPVPVVPIPPSAYHRIDVVYMDNVNIVLANSNTFIDATTTGPYDGVFIYVPIGPPLLGNYGSIQRLGTGTPDIWGSGSTTFLSGPATLSSNGTLPILLSDFEAVLNKSEVNLSWTSQIEVNSDHYSIERSADGTHWGSIGIVAAKGFSDVSVNYTFTDVSPVSGINYYRLQMVDRDGKYAYSDVKVVRRFVSGLSVFPNPARDLVNISLGTDFASDLTIRLLNQNGQLMQQQKLNNAAGTTISFAVGSYASGNYLLEVIDNKGNIQTSKVIISRP